MVRNLAKKSALAMLDLVKFGPCSLAQYRNHRHRLTHEPNALVISGVPRGGTTWLAELLMEIEDTTLLWEPLALYNLRRISDLPFWWRQYIPEDADWPEAEAFFRKIFGGEIIHPAILRRWDLPFGPTRNYLVKFCRANRLLPWLVKRFPIKAIALVRHPCAVVASQLRHSSFHEFPSRFPFQQGGRFADYYEPYRDILESLSTVEEVLAARWSLDYCVLLAHPDNDRAWITVAYERLVEDGAQEIRRIFDRLELECPPGIDALLRQPSATTVAGSPILRGGNQLVSWRKHLNSRQIDLVLNTVDRFHLSDVYSDEAHPQYQRLGSSSSSTQRQIE